MSLGKREFIIPQLSGAVCRTRQKLELEEWFSPGFSAKNNTRDKSYQLSKLCAEAARCRLCRIADTKTKLVFGEGSKDAKLVFVGEAPGREEDLTGKPFVGPAGKLLTRIIEAMGFKRSDVYITNALRCRPPQNRNPDQEEIANCRSALVALLNIIQPQVICALGKFAAWSLTGQQKPISKLRGHTFNFGNAKVIATFHPAYLLRNPQDKKLVWQDMLKIKDILKKNESC
ncbi:MAG: uracil-DNA glycosylase [Candidatus Omnitrophota bacterium]